MEKLVKPRGKPMLFPSFIPPFPPYNHERDQIFFQYSSNPIVDRSFGHVIVFSRDYFSYLIIILYLILLPLMAVYYSASVRFPFQTIVIVLCSNSWPDFTSFRSTCPIAAVLFYSNAIIDSKRNLITVP